MAGLAPQTLVWKLAGRVQLAAAGQAPGHSFQISDLQTLFEQLVVQLQQFPEPPDSYRPLENEPVLSMETRVRIISGFSGAGKTAWASQAATQLGSECAYYDVGDVPGPAIAANLARELTAQWTATNAEGMRRVLLPGNSGLDSLRALDQFVETNGIPALVVLDNAHRVPAADIRMLLDATRHLRFALLAQPSAAIAEIEATTGILQEMLQGWGLDQIAAEVNAQGARASTADLGRLLVLTGGLPLYVMSAAQLSCLQYGGDIAAMCGALETNANVVESAQELILSRTFEYLPDAVRDCVAVLSLSDIPLDQAEAIRLARAAIGLDPPAFVRALRQLKPLGVVRFYGTQRLQIHDAFRVLGQRRLGELTSGQNTAARQTLKDIIVESFESRQDTSRFPLYVRTLVELGELRTLVEIATEEFFHELGVDGGIWAALDAASSNDQMDPEQRFYALDGLVFSEMKHGKLDDAERHVVAMEGLAEIHKLGRHERGVVALKRMLLEADRGDEAATRSAMKRARSLTAKRPDHQRVLQYNIAYALFVLRRFPEAEAIARQVSKDYFNFLKLSPETIFGRSNVAIYEMMRKPPTVQDDMKHLADALDLLARSINAQGRDSGLSRVHAMKFYSLSHSLDSLIKVGQDLVDEFIGRTDYIGARDIAEQHLIPVVTEYKMVDRLLSVRSQYAVVLGYCGEYDAADAELDRLEPYRPGMAEIQCAELDGQRDFVAALREHGIRPGHISALAAEAVRRFNMQAGEACHCGSGLPYSRCHGA